MKDMLKSKSIIMFIGLVVVITIMGSFNSRRLDEIDRKAREELISLNLK